MYISYNFHSYFLNRVVGDGGIRMNRSDKKRESLQSDVAIWRGMILGIVMGATMWVGILGLLWYLFFR